MVVNIGSTLGTTLVFLVSRYLLRDWTEKKLSKKIQSVNEHLCENSINCILFFRLVPLFPFFAVNIGLSLSKAPLKDFFFGTMFGTLSATFIYVNAGNNIASINSFSEIMSVRVLGSLAFLGILALIPVIYKQMKSKTVCDKPQAIYISSATLVRLETCGICEFSWLACFKRGSSLLNCTISSIRALPSLIAPSTSFVVFSFVASAL